MKKNNNTEGNFWHTGNLIDSGLHFFLNIAVGTLLLVLGDRGWAYWEVSLIN